MQRAEVPRLPNSRARHTAATRNPTGKHTHSGARKCITSKFRTEAQAKQRQIGAVRPVARPTARTGDGCVLLTKLIVSVNRSSTRQSRHKVVPLNMEVAPVIKLVNEIRTVLTIMRPAPDCTPGDCQCCRARRERHQFLTQSCVLTVSCPYHARPARICQ